MASYYRRFEKRLMRVMVPYLLLKYSMMFVVVADFDSDLRFDFNNPFNDSYIYDAKGIDTWENIHYESMTKRTLIVEPPRLLESSSQQTGVAVQKPGSSDAKKMDNSAGVKDLVLLDTKVSEPTTNATNGTTAVGNSTLDDNCSNDYCISDQDYYDMIVQHILPSKSECLLIALHGVVFCVGLVGNALVCLAVYRNRSMRTVTNYFIVNLAVADFMVILFCLPPTVLWDVTQTWFMGTLVCKIVLYFQTVSVAVSVLTLTFISVDRWYAICFPLKFKSTTGRAKTAILIIWLLALVFDIPELLVLEAQKFGKFKEIDMDLIFFTQCQATWSEGTEGMYQMARILLLYTFPLMFMSIAYCQIVIVLWRSDNIPGHSETVLVHSGNGHGGKGRVANNSTECQLRSRRKAAKMLVAVVVMFAVCYFPVHLISILRMTMDIKQTEVTGGLAIVSHWLCYANSAVNPVIYNFMSGKFRKEFQRAFGNVFKRKPSQRTTRRGESTLGCRYTTMSAGTHTTPKTEIVQLNTTVVTINEIPEQSARATAPATAPATATATAPTTAPATAPRTAAVALNRAHRALCRQDISPRQGRIQRIGLVGPTLPIIMEEKGCIFEMRNITEEQQDADLEEIVIDRG
ncbi:orexin receptor type 1 isoform X2 [Nilaparvata lugens]|uniref:orexin receptor type 1 isoform X2 n=1 Tax=Nilaparvata lugens TaxID=108931 RepID=UPI00193E301C|nr:orexin receptor type 1 isoform X2 [Nilaparvata lugens]